jgi:hypothetical protein
MRSGLARFEQVLLYLDGPQVIVLSFGEKSKIIAVANDQVGGRGFFGAKVSNAQFSDYLDERFDLRYIMRFPDRKMWVEFAPPEDEDEKVRVDEARLTEEAIRRYLPGPGIFAREHTEDYAERAFVIKSTQRFEVDGNWDMKEFAKFHACVSDIYAVNVSVTEYAEPNSSQVKRKEISDSFVRPWRRGGSYYGFFRALSHVGGRSLRPNIKAIKWASPGYIEITGENESFLLLKDLISHYSIARSHISLCYELLYTYLQQIRYLNRDSSDLPAGSAEFEEVFARAQGLSDSLRIVPHTTLMSMAGGDPVVAGKVLLGLKRRIERLYSFFIESRVSIEGVNIRVDVAD